MSVLVLQSDKSYDRTHWKWQCLASVQSWAEARGYHYRFLDDSFYSILEPKAVQKLQTHPAHKVILSDLARLEWIKRYLSQGYGSVIWLDADFLVFDQEHFDPISYADTRSEGYLLGRECWFDLDAKGQEKLWRKVHNAFLLFRTAGKIFLDFYLDTAYRLILMQKGNQIPPQFVGPKLLSALNNIAHCPVYEHAGALSPYVLEAMCYQNTPTSNEHLKRLHSFKHGLKHTFYGANLSASVASSELDTSSLLAIYRSTFAH